MDKAQEVFADGVGEIVLSGGMVRMDLVAMMKITNLGWNFVNAWSCHQMVFCEVFRRWKIW